MIVVLIIFIISAIVLVGIILLQDDQGDGLGGLFGGGSGSAFGSRSGNVLTKATSILAAIFLITAFSAAWMNRSPQSEGIEAKARLKSLEEQGTDDWYVKTQESEQAEEEGEKPEIGNQGLSKSESSESE